MAGTVDKDGKLTGLSADGLVPLQFGDLLHKASEGKDFVLLADTHGEASIIRNAFSPESIAAMKTSGVKHLAVEFSKDDQDVFDGFASGKYSMAQVQRAFAHFNNSGLSAEDAAYMGKRIPQMMQEAKDAGITIHCVDLSRSDPRFRGEGSDAEMNALDASLTQQYKGDTVAMDARIDEMDKTQPGLKKRFEANDKEGLTLRYTHDKEIAEQLKPLAQDGKVVMLYGGNHFVKDRDIDDYLGKERTNVIRMHDNVQNTDSGFQGQYQAPDYVFYDKLNAENPTSFAGKLELEGKHSDACRAAIAVFKNNKDLTAGALACVTPDKDLEDFAASRMQTPPKPVERSADAKGRA